MSERKLVFVNGESETITFDGAPYLIVSLEGLGVPAVDRQEQKAPYQDGTTYIDSLLQNRDLVLEIAITKPNNFPEIAIARRTLVQRLCPKYGQGVLTYTDEDGNSYALNAVPASVVISNKDYRDPYPRAQITFTANDPYWKKTTSETITLPTNLLSAESVVNAASVNYPAVIQLSNGNLFVVYVRDGDNYLVSRTYTSSWSAESVINASLSPYPSVIEQSNGNLFVVYVRGGDNYLVSRTYTSSWSAESVINASTSSYPSLIERSNGNLFLVYVRANGYVVSRTYTSSWSAESVINSEISNHTALIERSNGNLFLVYRRPDNYLVSRTYTSSWSAESVINASSSFYPSVIEQSNGNLTVFYNRTSDEKLVSRTYTTSWSAEEIINSTSGSTFPSVIKLANSDLFLVYRRGIDGFIVSRTRAIAPVLADVIGDVPTPVLISFNGPSSNPQIVKQSTLEYIRLNTTLASGDSFVVDTTFGNKTVQLTQGGIVTNGIAFLDIGSTFFQLGRGSNTVYYEDDAVLSTATATMEWTERYIGV